jgi:pilus assembly protein CpaB
VNARKRRRRAYALLAVALACGGLAASEVGSRTAALEREQGAPVPVVVAARDIAPGSKLARADLTVRKVPSRYAPPDAPTTPGQAVGMRAAGPVAAGSPITGGVVGSADAGEGSLGLRRGERAIDLAVTGGSALGADAAPGGRVDIVVSTEAAAGAGRTFLALEDVELLAVASAPFEDVSTDSSPGGPGQVVVTLRVTLRQAVYLTAAQNFATEIRVLPRPLGDRRHIGRSTVEVENL